METGCVSKLMVKDINITYEILESVGSQMHVLHENEDPHSVVR